MICNKKWILFLCFVVSLNLCGCRKQTQSSEETSTPVHSLISEEMFSVSLGEEIQPGLREYNEIAIWAERFINSPTIPCFDASDYRPILANIVERVIKENFVMAEYDENYGGYTLSSQYAIDYAAKYFDIPQDEIDYHWSNHSTISYVENSFTVSPNVSIFKIEKKADLYYVFCYMTINKYDAMIGSVEDIEASAKQSFVITIGRYGEEGLKIQKVKNIR